MNSVKQDFQRGAVWAVTLCALSTFPIFLSPSAQSPQPPAAAPTPIAKPTPAPNPLALTADEAKIGIPLYNTWQEQQQQYAVALNSLRAAVKKPNDVGEHSRAAFALATAWDNMTDASAAWDKWLETAQTAHACVGCPLNLKTQSFMKANAPDAKPEK